MGPSHCWQRVPRGGPQQPEAPLLWSPNMPTTAYTRSKLAAAEVGAGAVPKCHESAPLPSPSGTKSLLCPQPCRGRGVLPPGSPTSLSLARGGALPSQGFWKALSLPTSRTSICTNTWAGALPRLSAAEPSPPPALSHAGNIPLESWWWPCKPHPQSSRHHLLLAPALFRHDLAESSPRHAQAGLPGSESPGVPRSRACSASALLISRDRNQAANSVLQRLLNPPQPLHQQRRFHKRSLISPGPNPSLVKWRRPGTSAATPVGTANPAHPDWDRRRSTGT